jgi:hypothetical protein
MEAVISGIRDGCVSGSSRFSTAIIPDFDLKSPSDDRQT